MKKIKYKIAALVCGIALLAGISTAQPAIEKIYEIDIVTSCGTHRCARGWDMASILSDVRTWEMLDCGFR
jgi:hypothetical protein